MIKNFIVIETDLMQTLQIDQVALLTINALEAFSEPWKLIVCILKSM